MHTGTSTKRANTSGITPSNTLRDNAAGQRAVPAALPTTPSTAQVALPFRSQKPPGRSTKERHAHVRHARRCPAARPQRRSTKQNITTSDMMGWNSFGGRSSITTPASGQRETCYSTRAAHKNQAGRRSPQGGTIRVHENGTSKPTLRLVVHERFLRPRSPRSGSARCDLGGSGGARSCRRYCLHLLHMRYVNPPGNRRCGPARSTAAATARSIGPGQRGQPPADLEPRPGDRRPPAGTPLVCDGVMLMPNRGTPSSGHHPGHRRSGLKFSTHDKVYGPHGEHADSFTRRYS